MEKVKINLGSGEDYKFGYLNVDNGLMFPNAKLDLTKDIKDFNTLSNSVDEILLSHVVMYYRPEELQPLLRKWYSWLKPRGKLIIETIDIRKVAKILLSHGSQEKINAYGLTNLFGNEQTGPHRWGWSEKALRDELYKAGFDKLKVEKGDKKPKRDFKIIAIK